MSARISLSGKLAEPTTTEIAAPLEAGAELAGAELASGLPEEHAVSASAVAAAARVRRCFFFISFLLPGTGL
jgi:hypothetical protein